MSVTATLNKCLNCGSGRFDEIWHLQEFPILFGAVPAAKKDTVKKYPITISVCQDCRLVQQTNLLPKEVVDDIYEEDYYSCPSPVTNQMGSDVIDAFYEFFQKNQPSARGGNHSGRLLEIACFDGYLLRKLEKDWDVFGCDPSTATGTIALSHFGKDRIRNDFFAKGSYPEGHFDVITFRHVLEHLYDLHEFLESVSFSLKQDGCIYIEVPNVEGILEFGSFGSFFHQHISYFTIHTLGNLLARHGFKIVNCQVSGVLHVKAVRTGKADVSAMEVIESNLTGVINKFYKNAETIRTHLKSVFNDPRCQRIAIFGASAMATVIVDIIDKAERGKIKGVFDNDTGKHGKFIVGTDIPIGSPDEIRKGRFDAVIISSYLFFNPMYQQLIAAGVDRHKITSINGIIQDAGKGP